jgi:heme-degrading monooxygenase HmoA
MPRLALTTFAIMKRPYGDPMIAGFEERTPAVFLAAENAPGFIMRAKERDNKIELTNFERDWGEWGKFTVPRFYDGGFETASDTRASTLSLWESIEAVRQFAFSGLHKEALARRQVWFRSPQWPTYAMWWVGDSTVPTWTEACRRLEYLHDNGPSEYAFSFHKIFPCWSEIPQAHRSK